MQQNGNGASEALRMVSLYATNFRRLSLARVKIDKERGVLRITGLNAQGKTSLLRIVPDTLMGGRKITGTPLREGAANGMSGILLNNGWTVEKQYDEKHPKGRLVVKAADGSRQNQEKLNALLGEVSIDPFTLFTLDAKQRQQLYLSLSPDPELPAKLAVARAQRDKLEEERTPHISTTRGRTGLVAPKGTRPEPVDTGAEMKRLQQLRVAQQQRDILVAQRLGAPDADGVLQGGTQQRIQKGRDKIAELERVLAAARLLLAQVEQQDTALAAQIEAMPDHTDAIKAVSQHIADARAIDQQLQPWVAYDQAVAAIETAEAEKKRLDAEIKDTNANINALLANARIPIPGMTFDDNGTPLYNGRPEADWSGREKADVALDVGFALKPRLRLILVDEEANSLDLPTLERIEQRAVEQDFLVLLVRIGLEGPGEIVVDDGVALNRDESPAAVRAAVADEQAEQDALAGQAEQDADAVAEARYEQERAAPDLFEIEQLPGSADF